MTMNTNLRKIYNILWIDDEWDKMPMFKKECEEFNNLHLEPYKTRKAGIDALIRDIDHWDAVLLDAKMLDENENETPSLIGLGKAKQKLDELSFRRNIPRFISTGQPDLISDQNFKEMIGDYYVKGNDDEKLINDMKEAIANSDRQQIKTKYFDVFSALSDMGISQYTDSILMDIFMPLHYPAKEPNFKPVHHYNQLRQLIDYLFRSCNEVGLVPDQCIIDGKVNLNQSSLYLAGKDAEKIGIRYGEKGERIVPEYIEGIIRSVLEFGNIHSHTVELSEEDSQKIYKILKSAKSRFIIYGLTLQLCEVIIWFAEYISNHNDKEINLVYCNTIQKEKPESHNTYSKYLNKVFIPEKDEDGVWHCEECFIGIKYWDKSELIITNISQNTNPKTQKKYPLYATFKKKI